MNKIIKLYEGEDLNEIRAACYIFFDLFSGKR